MVWGVCYTPHERYPCDRILFRSAKTGFLVSCRLNLIWCLPYSPKPPQLPRETLWIGWIRSWGWPTPPTSAHIVTEMTLTGRKTSNLAGCAPSMSKTLWNTLCGLLSKHWCHNNGHSLFNSLPDSYLATLSNSMPDRIHDTIRSGGNPIGYWMFFCWNTIFAQKLIFFYNVKRTFHIQGILPLLLFIDTFGMLYITPSMSTTIWVQNFWLNISSWFLTADNYQRLCCR